MTTPLSQDLRRRIVRAVEKGRSIRQAAARYEVSPSAAVKLMRRLGETRSVRPERVGGARCGITPAEIQAELRARGIVVQAPSTIHLMLKRMDLTHKKRRSGRPSR